MPEDPREKNKVEDEREKNIKKTPEYRRFKRLLKKVIKAPPLRFHKSSSLTNNHTQHTAHGNASHAEQQEEC